MAKLLITESITKKNIKNLVITKSELLEILGITQPSLDKLIKSGLPCINLSLSNRRKNLRFNLQDVLDFLANRQVKGANND